MSTAPITPTKAQIQLFNDLRNIIHYPPTHEALEKGVALIAESEARVHSELFKMNVDLIAERDQLRAEVERLTGVKETLKHNWSVTNTRAEKAEAELAQEKAAHVGTHMLVDSRDSELYREREKVRVLREALFHYRNCVVPGGTNPAANALAATEQPQSETTP